MVTNAYPGRVTEEHLGQLHPRVISDTTGIRELLDRACRERVVFRRGMNRNVLPELAWLREIKENRITFRTRNFDDAPDQHQVLLQFDIGGSSFFFSTAGSVADGRMSLWVPRQIFGRERRDRPRESRRDGREWRAYVETSGRGVTCEVVDAGPGGLQVLAPERLPIDSMMRVRITAGPREGTEQVCRVTHSRRQSGGGIALGLAYTAAGEVSAEQRKAIVPGGFSSRSRTSLRVAGAVARGASWRVLGRVLRTPAADDVEICRFSNSSGREIVGLVDGWRHEENATAVVIPPAWGRTKETLLPLARTIVSTFRSAREPIVVLRFDGTYRRGESYVPPECRQAGREYHGFTFSQAVEDIEAAASFVRSSYGPSKQILVTFSAASIDGRKAIARDDGRSFDGWVSVVGSADLQSLIRVISGGVDYVGGIDRGLRFGFQEILGVEVDIDLAGLDALENGLAYLEDSRKDMEAIHVPIVWYHGRHDAWMDPSRVRDVLAYGSSRGRSLIEVPTGHQLRSSREALRVFQAIASDVGKISLGRRLSLRVPSAGDLTRRQRVERRRRKRRDLDLRSFWRDYLVGRNELVGFELMAATAPYRRLMDAQTALLGDSERLVDIGCGVGSSVRSLVGRVAPSTSIVQIDLVASAVQRARERALESAFRPVGIVSDLSRTPSLPLRTASADAVLASLLLSYLDDPQQVLREIRRILKPGGWIVASTLRRDADISKIFGESLEELQGSSGALSELGLDSAGVSVAARSFLNDAARLLQLEEEGEFNFWSEGEFRDLMARAGFKQLQVAQEFGDPPQAIVVAGRKA